MNTKIFVNLPVKDLSRSVDFFKKLGYTFNPQFSDETAVCMVISDDIYAMLLTYDKFKSFSKKEITDTSKSSEVIIALSANSIEEVNSIADKAISAGGTVTRPPEEYGFMFGRSFNDPDGHFWEVYWMDPDYVQKQQAPEEHIAENI
jgi:uncharacterized protein